MFGATLEGTIYDYSLTKVDQAVVEISSTPLQRQVTLDGRYTFEVPPGNYTLHAQAFRRHVPISNISQKVSISNHGRFTIDLILLPILDINEESLDDLDIETLFPPPQEGPRTDINQGKTITNTLIAITLTAALALFLWRRNTQYTHPVTPVPLEPPGTPQYPLEEKETKNTPIPPESPERQDITLLLRILKEHEGRATQRDLRKALPYSEAKTSLMLTELEASGRIKKIRKGRGNIIILQDRGPDGTGI